MPRPDKIAAVKEITADLKATDVYYFVDYRGLTFAEATELRDSSGESRRQPQGGQEHPGQDRGGRRRRGGAQTSFSQAPPPSSTAMAIP